MTQLRSTLITTLAVCTLGYSLGSTAAPLAISDNPLSVSSSVTPNIMFLIDNSGSMSNVVPDVPFNPATVYLAACTGINLVPAGTSVDLRIVSGAPRLFYGGASYVWGTAAGQRCFSTTVTYGGRLNASAGTAPGSYLDADYSGNYLNWYFNRTNITGVTWTTQQRKPLSATALVSTRMEITKTSASSLVDRLSNVRVGLATYNDGDGARISEGVSDINVAGKKGAMTTQINDLTPSGNTPLAESLQDIGRYFVGTTNNTLTLHPGKPNQTTSPAHTVFHHIPVYRTGVSNASPIQYFCQKSFTVIMSDGRPQGDRAISATSGLRDYTGDCAAGQCIATATTADIPSSVLTNTSHQNGTKIDRRYEAQGSDYLDDVAKALFDIDLRPDLTNPSGKAKKNNMRTYTIGLADDQIINDPMLRLTAAAGDGTFTFAANAAQLDSAFDSAITDIEGKDSSSAAVAASTGFISSGTFIYQARFNGSDWSGQLLALPISPDNPATPANEEGTIGAERWDAGKHDALDATPIPASRSIFTIDPAAAVGSRGRAFVTLGSLTSAQQAALNTNSVGVLDAAGQARLDYLRGANTNEAPSGLDFRARPVTKLGDIVNSAPEYVAAPAFRYPDTLESVAYSSFRTAHQNRTPVVYVGANDGMLHAFDARDASGGRELFAYVPNAVFPNLSRLTAANYNANHRFFVDGSPNVGDVFYGGAWRTVLVGGLNKGGQAIYALDVTNPDSFGVGNVLWEFTDADLGYTHSQPAIVRMKNGEWAAVFGNGYNNSIALPGETACTGPNTPAGCMASHNGRAWLYIVNIATGALIKKIDTGVGTTAIPNGLATPAAVDVDGDNIIEYIYAGDLQGNMWKFDVTGSNAGTWDVAFGGKPLFTACTATCTTANRQPITTRPEAGFKKGGGQIIYFGTGKYLEAGDVTRISPTHTFYGIFDDNQASSAYTAPVRTELLQQQVLQELAFPVSGYDVRVTSDNQIAGHRGWYMDLPTSTTLPATGREMQVSNSVLRSGRIIFTTLIPSPDACGFGGTGWLMELDAKDGSRLGFSAFDLNRDDAFNNDDFVAVNFDVNGDGRIDADDKAPASGKKSKEGIISTPTIIATPTKELKFSSGSSGAIEVTRENQGSAAGRQSWRELFFTN